MPASPFPPDDPAALDPAEALLPAGSVVFRVHHERFAADELNPGLGAGGRFHFVRDGEGEKVPSLYAAESAAAAIAETVFHDVPVRPLADRRVAYRKLEGRTLSRLETAEDLRLVELHHPGLGRLGLEPRDLTDTDPSAYPRTRRWAQALHDHPDGFAGLVWTSRLFNRERACAFFGDRVSATAFGGPGDPLPLWQGPGLDLVYELAEAAGITVVHG